MGAEEEKKKEECPDKLSEAKKNTCQDLPPGGSAKPGGPTKPGPEDEQKKKAQLPPPGAKKSTRPPFRGILIYVNPNGSLEMQTPGMTSVYEVYGAMTKAMEMVKKKIE